MKGDLLFQDKPNLDAAIDIYRKALAVDPRYFPARVSLVNALFSKNDKPTLAAQIEELRKAAPNNSQTLYFDAQFAYLNKDYKKAGELIQKVLSISSGSAQVVGIPLRVPLMVLLWAPLVKGERSQPRAGRAGCWKVFMEVQQS